ncbi:hypothetical protein FRC03_011685 [Tulasnella sp. 419]|nr:hypothetical protein FRC03_011685 [Tulasnella sp. 419]
MAGIFRNTYSTLRHQAHENPTIFWSLLIGFAGPVMAITVPPIRKSFGWKPSEKIPTSYPLPNRPRQLTVGYEDS